MPSIFRSSYVQVILAGPFLSVTRDYGRDLSLHTIESSKCLIDDELEVYDEEGEEEVGDESEFVPEFASLDVTTSVA